MSKTKLALKTANGEWSMSLSRALWLGYGIPLSFVTLYLVFGLEGLLGGIIIAALSVKK